MSSVTHRIDTTYLNEPVEFYPPKISKEEYRENITNLANHLIDTNKGYQGKEADAKNPFIWTWRECHALVQKAKQEDEQDELPF